MTTEQATRSKKLLSPAQVTQCKKIAASGDDYSSARANALLALHQGTTQANTATETGLSIGQVRYWVARFRKLGMDVFPSKPAPEAAVKKTAVTAAPKKAAAKKPKKAKTKSKSKDKKKSKDDKPKKKEKDKKVKKEKPSKKDKKKDKSKKKAKKKK